MEHLETPPAILWDIDDTLIRTTQMALNARRVALKHISLSELELQQGLRIWNRLLWYYKPEQIAEILSAIASWVMV